MQLYLHVDAGRIGNVHRRHQARVVMLGDLSQTLPTPAEAEAEVRAAWL